MPSDQIPSLRERLKQETHTLIADALLAVYAATSDAVQRRIVAGEHPRRFLDAVLSQADASLDVLKYGIRDFP